MNVILKKGCKLTSKRGYMLARRGFLARYYHDFGHSLRGVALPICRPPNACYSRMPCSSSLRCPVHCANFRGRNPEIAGVEKWRFSLFYWALTDHIWAHSAYLASDSLNLITKKHYQQAAYLIYIDQYWSINGSLGAPFVEHPNVKVQRYCFPTVLIFP